MERSLNQIITERLNKCSARYLTSDNKWHIIFPYYPIKVSEDYVNVRFSKNSWAGTIRLLYPFQVSDDTAYMFGLILGSALKYNDRLILNVGIEQIPKIIAFCRQFNVAPKIEKIQKRTKNRGKKTYNQFFTSAIAYIPFPIYKYMMALGLNLNNPRIPPYFSSYQRHLVISGYLNSKKNIITHQSTPRIYQRVQINVKSRSNYTHCAKNFAMQVYEELKKYSINSKLHINKLQSSIRVNNEHIPRLQEEFDIERPQIKFRAKFIGLCKKYPHIIRTANLYKLSSFELTILEIAFYYFFQEGQSEIEYTRFEELLTYSSNTIRKCLYNFQEKGILQYFAKGKKEFVHSTFLCFSHAKNYWMEKVNSLKSSLEKKGMILVCKDCGTGIDYIIAMEESFRCPSCQSMRLQEYSKIRLARSLVAYNRELNLFKKSYEVMCSA